MRSKAGRSPHSGWPLDPINEAMVIGEVGASSQFCDGVVSSWSLLASQYVLRSVTRFIEAHFHLDVDSRRVHNPTTNLGQVLDTALKVLSHDAGSS